MRLPILRSLAFAVAAAPALAWDFSPDPVCTLSFDGKTSVTVTYDPRLSEYAIRLTRPDRPWPPGAVFAIRFEGARGLTISTDRHASGDGGTTLTVRDTGFGNVLDGLQFNETATALIGDTAETIPLDGAAEPVEAFRACAEGLAA